MNRQDQPRSNPKLDAIYAKLKVDLEHKQEKITNLMYTIFHCSDEGRELLQLLKEVYLIESPVANPEVDSRHSDFREGQNNLIRLMGESKIRYEMQEAKRA